MNLQIMQLEGNNKHSEKIKNILNKQKYGIVMTFDTLAKELGVSKLYAKSLIDESIKAEYSEKMKHGGTNKRFFGSKKTILKLREIINKQRS